MKINHEEQIVVQRDRYEYLCGLEGRTEALQNYVDNSEYVYVDDILLILGIDTKKYKDREAKKHKEYMASIAEKGDPDA